LTVFLLASCTTGPKPAADATPPAPVTQALPAPLLVHPDELPADARLDLAVLRATYPDVVLGMERDPGGAAGQETFLLVLAGHRRLVYSDGKARTVQQALNEPDIRTMMSQVYPLGPVTEAMAHPAPHFDPGRSRVQELFTTIYGSSEAEVRAACTRVPFLKRKPLFTTRLGAAAALERVGKRIAPLEPEHPEYRRLLWPMGGSLCWRAIAGTGRLSMHSFGIAIDLNPSLPYWRTEPHPETIPHRVMTFAPDIVAAFEAEGFIWGGKWAAYDLMHFEYRPEIILKAKVLAGQVKLP